MENTITPSEREQDWHKDRILISKTDSKGVLLYVNDAFLDVSGYDGIDIINKPHSVVRHPDMPKVIFKYIWQNLEKQQDCSAIIKNMSKTGRYYWVSVAFKAVTNSNGDIQYSSTQTAAKEDIVHNTIEPLYKKLKEIEQISIESSVHFFEGFLEENQTSFENFFETIVPFSNIVKKIDKEVQKVPREEKKGFFSGMFSDKKK